MTPWAAPVASSSADGHGGCWTGAMRCYWSWIISPASSDSRGPRQLIFFFTRNKIMPFSKHINISLRRFSISTAQVCNILCAQVLTSEVPGILLPPFPCHWQRWGRELWIHRFLSKKPGALCSSFVGQHAFKIFF